MELQYNGQAYKKRFVREFIALMCANAKHLVAPRRELIGDAVRALVCACTTRACLNVCDTAANATFGQTAIVSGANHTDDTARAGVQHGRRIGRLSRARSTTTR
uniref:LEF6 n=1 Tax=Spilarctia obliqua nucleopolyhedrovirus TaxID=1638618 RepID=A0A7G9U8F5_9ABAC|nr:LEF6 [Spilarctia obliqua nucleopolyhedrovirus]